MQGFVARIHWFIIFQVMCWYHFGCMIQKKKHPDPPVLNSYNILGGGLFFFVFFSPLPGWDDPIWRSYFSRGLVQPPTSISRIDLRGDGWPRDHRQPTKRSRDFAVDDITGRAECHGLAACCHWRWHGSLCLKTRHMPPIFFWNFWRIAGNSLWDFWDTFMIIHMHVLIYTWLYLYNEIAQGRVFFTILKNAATGFCLWQEAPMLVVTPAQIVVVRNPQVPSGKLTYWLVAMVYSHFQ